MKKAIMATKIGMTQIFREDGTLVPVTTMVMRQFRLALVRQKRESPQLTRRATRKLLTATALARQ